MPRYVSCDITFANYVSNSVHGERNRLFPIFCAVFDRSLDRDWKEFKVRGFLPFIIRWNGGGRIPVNYRTIVRIYIPRRPRCTRGNNKGLCSREERESFFIAISGDLHWRVRGKFLDNRWESQRVKRKRWMNGWMDRKMAWLVSSSWLGSAHGCARVYPSIA